MERTKSKRSLAQRGMTLIEIMVVVAIMGMLMGSVGVFAFGQLKKAKLKEAAMIIRSIDQALTHFQLDNAAESCPKTLSELYTQKYLTKEPADPWAQPLIFRCPGEHNPDGADIVSKGPDKQEGTADDIKSWEL